MDVIPAAVRRYGHSKKVYYSHARDIYSMVVKGCVFRHSLVLPFGIHRRVACSGNILVFLFVVGVLRV